MGRRTRARLRALRAKVLVRLERLMAAVAVPARDRRSETGAATAEYTLVTLVAATIALLLLNWAKGGAVTEFFQTIFDQVVGLFSE